MDDMRKKKLFIYARPDQQVKGKLNSRPMIYSYTKYLF
jgi:hypothetical protein